LKAHRWPERFAAVGYISACQISKWTYRRLRPSNRRHAEHSNPASRGVIALPQRRRWPRAPTLTGCYRVVAAIFGPTSPENHAHVGHGPDISIVAIEGASPPQPAGPAIIRRMRRSRRPVRASRPQNASSFRPCASRTAILQRASFAPDRRRLKRRAEPPRFRTYRRWASILASGRSIRSIARLPPALMRRPSSGAPTKPRPCRRR
jgi:hypothetical protein